MARVKNQILKAKVAILMKQVYKIEDLTIDPAKEILFA